MTLQPINVFGHSGVFPKIPGFMTIFTRKYSVIHNHNIIISWQTIDSYKYQYKWSKWLKLFRRAEMYAEHLLK